MSPSGLLDGEAQVKADWSICQSNSSSQRSSLLMFVWEEAIIVFFTADTT